MVQVKVEEGILEGEKLRTITNSEYFSFKGIPYAEPPIGDRRFKAPFPPKPWNGVRNAKTHGPTCSQFHLFRNCHVPGSEDCLYLNIYTNNLKPDAPLPVIFYIHGGAFLCGSGNDDRFGPDFLIDNDVILVTFNYRLEVLGFLCLDTPEIPGNAGMKDQVAALRWIRKNINNFGGDPDNITIAGESAGAGSVSFHLISPMSKGLFKRAIMMSGCSYNEWATILYPKERAIALAKQLGCNKTNSKELQSFFMNQPTESLLHARTPVSYHEHELEGVFCAPLYFSAVDEKDFGQERFFYEDCYKNASKILNDVEVIIGATNAEGIFSTSNIEKLKENYSKRAEKSVEFWTPTFFRKHCYYKDVIEIGRKIMEYFFEHGINLNNLLRYHSMFFFTFPIWLWAKDFSKICSKIYLYEFNCYSERNLTGKMAVDPEHVRKDRLVNHAEDLCYIFKNTACDGSATTTEHISDEAKKMIFNTTKLWTNFAKFGNPTPDGTLGVIWEPYDDESDAFLSIDEELKMKSRFGQDTEFWNALYERYCRWKQ